MERLLREGYGETIRKKTGLVPDAYFSGTKLAWLLDTLNLHERAEKGELCFGTVDSYLAWQLVEGRPHVTDRDQRRPHGCSLISTPRSGTTRCWAC